MTVAASYFVEDDKPKTLFDGVEMQEVPDNLKGGINMPGRKDSGKNFGAAPGAVRSGEKGTREEKYVGRIERRQKETGNEEVVEQRPLDELMDELDHLIGLKEVKKNLSNLVNVIRVRKIREEMGLAQPEMSLHLVFSGNPGTGKTTVARLLAKIYRALGVVSKGQLVEVDRAGLVEGYVGQTAQKTQEVIDSAMGGVLFIDEAYTLTNKKENGDFGQEAVDTLLKRMEDDRDSFVVIVAGYTDEMEEFLQSNPGLRSRFSKFIEFTDYTEEELYTIFCSMCAAQDFHLAPEADQEVKEYFHRLVEDKDEHFANGREVRNFFERSVERQANRLVQETSFDRSVITTFTKADVTEAE